MNYSLLKTEIETGPLAAELTGKGDVEVADILNRIDTPAVCERYVTARTVLAEMGAEAGAAVLDKLAAAATQSSPVKWMLQFLEQDSGLDVGQVQTQGSIDALVTAGVLTESEGTALKNMALRTVSRAEIAGFGTVTAGDVSRALRGPY